MSQTLEETAGQPRCPVCGWEWREGLPQPDETGSFFCARPSCGVELTRVDETTHRLRTLRQADHYSLCVLPFSFGEPGVADIVRRLERAGRWKRRTFRNDDAEDVDRTEYFLPYVRRFLFPSLYAQKESADGEGVDPSGPGAPSHHFRFDLGRLGPTDEHGLPLEMHARDVRKEIVYRFRLVLESAELIVFGFRVGFLILRFRDRDRRASLFDQMNALAFLRTIAPLYRGFEMPVIGPPGRPSYHVPQLLAFLLAEFGGAGTLPEAPWRLPERARPPVRLIHDDRMMVYSFSCLDKQTCLADPKRCRDLMRKAAVVTFDEKLSEEPPPHQEDPFESEAWLRVRRQGFSKDGSSLIVFNTDRFHEHFLGIYHGTYYFDIFLLGALQRVTLLTLSERLSDIPGLTTNDRYSRRQLRRVRKDLLLFKNQCWFSQITNRERGLQLWKTWQAVFETQTLLHEVNEQSEELETYLQTRYRERMERLVRLGGFLATAVPAILGLEVFLGKYTWFPTLRLALLAVLFAGSGLFAWYLLSRRGED